jgi:hypothetical protein
MPRHGNDPVIVGRQAVSTPMEDAAMPTQYVFPSKLRLFRNVQHGRRWRALHGRIECGRHDSAEAALMALRGMWPQARLPQTLEVWRRHGEAPLAHVSRTALPRWCAAY